MFKTLSLVLELIPVLAIVIIIAVVMSFLRDLGVKVPRHPLRSLAQWLKEVFRHEKETKEK